MKKTTWLWVIGGAYVAWWLLRKKKTGMKALTAMQAASTARQLVANAVDQTTFQPDTTTMKDLYKQDQNACK